jgi:hypothetical protein
MTTGASGATALEVVRVRGDEATVHRTAVSEPTIFFVRGPDVRSRAFAIEHLEQLVIDETEYDFADGIAIGLGSARHVARSPLQLLEQGGPAVDGLQVARGVLRDRGDGRHRRTEFEFAIA